MNTNPEWTQFRKKPVVIEAVQIDKRMDLTAPPWWAEAVQQNRVILRGMGKFTRDLPMVEIETLEGTMTGVQGDWIIRGVKGELYPCKPDIFAATYEPASALPDPYTVTVDPDPRGVSVGVYQGSRCVYNGAHPIPTATIAQGDAQDGHCCELAQAQGVAVCDQCARENEQLREAWTAPAAGDALDAERWRHCMAHGFPGRNLWGKPERSVWFYPAPVNEMPVHFDNPTDAVDAARAAIAQQPQRKEA